MLDLLERRRDFIGVTFAPNDIAEITDATPQWYVLKVAPNHENVAAAHLVGRRFAIYLPELDKYIPASRRRASRTERRPLFPGYLFAFVWDIAAHARRILGCPGVTGLLSHADGTPAIIPDALIRQLLRSECQAMVGGYRPKKRWRRSPMDILDSEGMEVVDIETYCAWRNIKSLDDKERNGLLFKALGL